MTSSFPGYDDWLSRGADPGTYEDEADYDPDPYDDYEPDPTDHPEFERYEYERYLRSLSPLGRLRYRVASFIWRYMWKWRIRRNRNEPYSDEPPF